MAVSGSHGVTSQNTFLFAVLDSTTFLPITTGGTVQVVDENSQATGSSSINGSGVAAVPVNSPATINAVVTVTSPGYHTLSEPYQLNSQRSTTITIGPLQVLTSSVTVQVMDSVTGAAIGNAICTLGLLPTQATDSTGQTTFLGVPYGTYTLGVTSSGYDSFSGSEVINQP